MNQFGSGEKMYKRISKIAVIAFAVLFVLVACGGGSSDAPAKMQTETTLSDVGIASVRVGDGGSIQYVMQEPQASILLTLLRNPAADDDIEINASSAVKIDSYGPDHWALSIDTSHAKAGTSAPLILTATNKRTGKFAKLSIALQVLDTASTPLKIDAAGGIYSNDGAIVRILPNQLERPVAAQLLSAALPSNQGRRVHVVFPADYSKAGILVEYTFDTENDTSESTKRRSLSLPNAGGTIEDEWKKQTYLSENNSEIGAYKWKETQWVFFQGHRLAQNSVTLPQYCSAPISPSSTPSRPPCPVPERRVASTLTSLLSDQHSKAEWSRYEPVLFVNGFAPCIVILDCRGGGYGTWGKFTDIVKTYEKNLLSADETSRFVPFEFRWATDTSFVTAGADLANAIETIKAKTGKNVTIVAHSFGGVLVRTVLQGLASSQSYPFNESSPQCIGSKSSSNLSARCSVRAVLTLGTPHSGIFPSAGTRYGANFPAGADLPVDFLYYCNQLSCNDAGAGHLTDHLQFYSVINPPAPGKLMADLANTEFLAGIPIFVGIGLKNNESRYGSGDGLITFFGQRFHPEVGSFTDTPQLLDWGSVGNVLVKERILGVYGPVRPSAPGFANYAGGSVGLELANDQRRKHGYVHASPALLPQFLVNRADGEYGIDLQDGGSFQFGLDANISESGDCGDVTTCRHAALLGFKELALKSFSPANGKPVARFTTAADSPAAGQAVAFDPITSSSAFTNIISWKWDYGDGVSEAKSTGAAVMHIYASPGMYRVSLVVVDDIGASSTAFVMPLQVKEFGNGPNSLYDDFIGTALDASRWNQAGSGAITLSAGIVSFSCFAQANTRSKVQISGGKIVVEARFRGVGHDYGPYGLFWDTAVTLIDADDGSVIQFGDTNYHPFGNIFDGHPAGMYVSGTGRYAIGQDGNVSPTTSWKEYSLTIDDTSLILRRGDSIANLTETVLRSLPNSIRGRRFYVSISSGGPDYCPSAFDWVSVKGSP